MPHLQPSTTKAQDVTCKPVSPLQCARKIDQILVAETTLKWQNAFLARCAKPKGDQAFNTSVPNSVHGLTPTQTASLQSHLLLSAALAGLGRWSRGHLVEDAGMQWNGLMGARSHIERSLT